MPRAFSGKTPVALAGGRRPASSWTLKKFRVFSVVIRSIGMGRIDFWRKLLQSLLFPQACGLCGEPTLNRDLSPLCEACRATFPPFERRICHFCGVPVPGSLLDSFTVCRRCVAESLPFDYARAWGAYEGTLRTAIRRFKFDGLRRLANPFSLLMAEATRKSGFGIQLDWILPVPSHPKRTRQRGYDQTLLLARRLSHHLGVPLFTHLRRTRHTAPQFGLNREQRRHNLRDAFQLRREELLAGKSVLLVDDVMTTGATVGEVSRVLRGQSRVATIVVIVLARPRLAFFD